VGVRVRVRVRARFSVMVAVAVRVYVVNIATRYRDANMLLTFSSELKGRAYRF